MHAAGTNDRFPVDEHDRAVIANVAPPDRENPVPAPLYNVVVIGAGAGGLITALGAAGLGARVALVEKNLLGGDCLNVGCVPSKGLIRAGRAAAAVREARDFGIGVAGEPEIDFGAVMARMRRLRARISANDAVAKLEEAGVDVFLGRARFRDPHAVELDDGSVLRFKKAVIATGGRPFVPPIPGLREADPLTNETVFNLTARPARMLFVGGGPIGCELAQTFARLGTVVTMIEKAEHFLVREDADAAAVLRERFARDGVDVRLASNLVRVERTGGAYRCVIERGGREESVEADRIFVGAGRMPNIEDLDLDAAGVEYHGRGVVVDPSLRTSRKHIFAVGDICLPFKFTHIADASARIAVQNLFFPLKRRWTDLVVPWCTYTQPEIAHVGLYERQARSEGIPVRTLVRPLAEVDRAILDGDDAGFVKIHLREGTGRILGATIVADHAGEMISEITLAMTARTGLLRRRLGLGALSSVIHPYPTQAEAVRQLADRFNGERLTPLARRIIALFVRRV